MNFIRLKNSKTQGGELRVAVGDGRARHRAPAAQRCARPLRRPGAATQLMRAVTDGGDGAGTRETPRDVPEADLPRVVIAHREIVGYTISNDVSSPSIEGENPWHLSRAKIYMASYDLAPEVRPVCDIADPLPLLICVENGPELREAWEAAVSTVQLHRKLDDPVDWLFAQQEGPDGVVPSASICLARPIETTLPPGDLVCIRIDDVGELSNYMGIPLTAAS